MSIIKADYGSVGGGSVINPTGICDYIAKSASADLTIDSEKQYILTGGIGTANDTNQLRIGSFYIHNGNITPIINSQGNSQFTPSLTNATTLHIANSNPYWAANYTLVQLD